LSLFTLALLALTLAYAVFQRAGVTVSDWNPCLAATGVIAVVHFLIPHRQRLPKLDRIVAISASIFLGVAALQLLPLPVAVVRVLSPARVELLLAIQPIAGELPRFVTLSAVPYETAEYLLTLAGYAAVLLLVRDLTLRASRRPWRAVWPLLIIGALEAILGLYQASSAPNAFATGTYASRDHYAGLLEMILPFAAAYPVALLQREGRYASPGWIRMLPACGIWAIAAVLLAAIVQSLCRMAFLASLAGFFVAGILALSTRRINDTAERSHHWWRKLLSAAAVAVVVFFGLVLLPSDALLKRFADLGSNDSISSDARSQIWRDTAGLIRAFPVFGCGLGGYESCLLRFKTVAPMQTVNYAHNDYLQVQAEMGAIGFVAGLVLVGRLLQQAVRGVRAAGSVDERYLAIACTASMTVMLLHSMVDFNMYVPANGMVFAWVAGIASMHAKSRF
jgi:O-antigen ligase